MTDWHPTRVFATTSAASKDLVAFSTQSNSIGAPRTKGPMEVKTNSSLQAKLLHSEWPIAGARQQNLQAGEVEPQCRADARQNLRLFFFACLVSNGQC
jgi:hypothetical protein